MAAVVRGLSGIGLVVSPRWPSAGAAPGGWGLQQAGVLEGSDQAHQDRLTRQIRRSQRVDGKRGQAAARGPFVANLGHVHTGSPRL